MNTVIAIVIGSVLGALFLLTRKFNNKEQTDLQNKKDEVAKQLAAVQADQKGLKAAAVASQANATEEDKEEFWNETLNPKSDSNK